jgi:uncharacterized RDD family membrane protein YckC
VANSARAAQARQVRARRLGALVLDTIAYSILVTVVNNVYGVTQVTSGPAPNGTGFAQYTTATAVAWPWLILLWLAYYIVSESLFGASLGKMFLGLCVVRVDGRPLSVGAIVVRNLLRIVDALPAFYLIGGLAVLMTGHSQRVGDRWAGTTVVARDHALEPGATRHPVEGAGRTLSVLLLSALLFTIAFDYFGRPPLVLQGLFNEHRMLADDVTSYQLGSASWSPGHVIYPITVIHTGQLCSGTLEMNWDWTGWEEGYATYLCKP